MGKIVTNFLIALLLILATTVFYKNVFAATDDEFKYEDYLRGISEGWIGEDVPYEMLLELQKESKEIEESLSNSESFYEVKDLHRLEPGDIIVTNSTSSFGLTGHAAIAISNNNILNIAGPGQNPTTLDTEYFKNKYKKGYIKVYRPKDSDAGRKAAEWACNTYENSNAKFMITTNLGSTNVTYCSKIVWQSYYFGVGKDSVFNTNYKFRIVVPYALRNKEIKNIELEGDLKELKQDLNEKTLICA